MSQTCVAPARIVRSHGVRFRPTFGTPRAGQRSFTPVVWPSGNQDQLLIVRAVTEEPLAEVRTARVRDLSWVLNGVGSMSFTASAWDDALLSLVDTDTVVDGAGRTRLLGREAQWWRNGVLYWSGPFTSLDINLDGTVDGECMDLGWYLSRKVWGPAERFDLLHGIGSMDRAGLPGWTATGTVTANRSTAIKARGAGSAALTGTGSITARVQLPTVGPGNDSVVRLTAVARIPSGTLQGTGLIALALYDAAGDAVSGAGGFAAVGEESAIGGGFSRVTCFALIPADGEQYYGEVSLLSEGSHGTIFFDDVRLLRNDTTGSTHPNGEDLCTHAVAMLNHMQSATIGNSSLGFRPRIVHNTGTVERQGVRHLEHQDALDWLRTYTDRDDGFDWWMDERRREFCISNRRGVDHENIAIHPRTAQAGGWGVDVTEQSSKVIVLGDDDGSGVDRPEGGFTDTSGTAGLTLDYVHRPPSGTRLSALDPMARELHRSLSQPQETPDRIVVDESWLDDIQPGDTFPVDLRSGVFRAEARWRLSQMTLTPETGKLALT